jgi:hypothetical protein
MRGPLNCRSLGFAGDDKGEGGASMENSCSVKAVFFDRALKCSSPACSRGLPHLSLPSPPNGEVQ